METTIEQIQELLQRMQDEPYSASQAAISLPKIQRNLVLLSAGSQPPDIYVKNNIVIEGHHRYIAGKLFGALPGIIDNYPVVSSQKIKWPDVKVDEADWDNPFMR